MVEVWWFELLAVTVLTVNSSVDVQGEAISHLTAEAWTKLGQDATEQWTQTQKLLYNQTAQKDKNQCAETVQSPVLDEMEMLQQDFTWANN